MNNSNNMALKGSESANEWALKRKNKLRPQKDSERSASKHPFSRMSGNNLSSSPQQTTKTEGFTTTIRCPRAAADFHRSLAILIIIHNNNNTATICLTLHLWASDIPHSISNNNSTFKAHAHKKTTTTLRCINNINSRCNLCLTIGEMDLLTMKNSPLQARQI
jgi:hypothetical protein